MAYRLPDGLYPLNMNAEVQAPDSLALENGVMKIEVLHIEECPNWEHAGDRVREALAELGDTATTVSFRLLRTPEDAASVAFAGSPTITADGEDLFPDGSQTTDLACRIYFTPNGVAGLPTVDQLEDAISAHE